METTVAPAAAAEHVITVSRPVVATAAQTKAEVSSRDFLSNALSAANIDLDPYQFMEEDDVQTPVVEEEGRREEEEEVRPEEGGMRQEEEGIRQEEEGVRREEPSLRQVAEVVGQEEREVESREKVDTVAADVEVTTKAGKKAEEMMSDVTKQDEPKQIEEESEKAKVMDTSEVVSP